MMEHLSYFNEYNFLKLILESGYEPIYISKIYERTLMPFITVLAKKIVINFYPILVNRIKYLLKSIQRS